MPSHQLPQIAVPATGNAEPPDFTALLAGIEKTVCQVREQQDALEQSREELRKFQQALYLELIDALDRIESWTSSVTEAAREDPATAAWSNRLEMLSRTLMKLLARRRVIPLDLQSWPEGTVTVNERIKVSGISRQAIHEVLERGWLWNGEVLRKATVNIAVPEEE